ncbi:Protein bir1 [Fusarium oxysporum f. sp. albedinis]|nr:Protein bir1 [Fusarium oxysporum f. sp. albedinis]
MGLSSHKADCRIQELSTQGGTLTKTNETIDCRNTDVSVEIQLDIRNPYHIGAATYADIMPSVCLSV